MSTERRELSVLTAKGDKPRIVPVPDAVYTELLAYLHERGGKRGTSYPGKKATSVGGIDRRP